MSLSATTTIVRYTGDASTVAFAYPFKIWAATDLEVSVNSVVKTLTTDYSVSGVGAAGGGTVTFNTAPAMSAAIVFRRVLPRTQLTTYTPNFPFPESATEDALDRLVMLVQELVERAGRAPTLPAKSLLTDLVFPEPGISGTSWFVRWKADGTGLEVASITGTALVNPMSAVGDTLYAAAGVVLSRLAIGNEGDRLSVVGGLPVWQAGDRTRLTNKTGASLAAGDVVVADSANDSAVKYAVSAGQVVPVFVAAETIGINGVGYFYKAGAVASVQANGSITRGDFVKVSATNKKVDSAGTAMGAGVCGYALTTAAGGVVTVFLWGFTSGAGGIAPLRLTPEAAIFPNTNFPQLVKNVGTNFVDLTLDYDTTTEEAAYWRLPIPVGAVFTAATIEIYSRQGAAVTGTLGWKVTTKTGTDGESWDAAGTLDTIASVNVKGVAGQILRQSAALTITGWAASEMLFIKIARDVATDTVAEDGKFMSASILLS